MGNFIPRWLGASHAAAPSSLEMKLHPDSATRRTFQKAGAARIPSCLCTFISSANISCATNLKADGALGLQHPGTPHVQGIPEELARIILAA